MKKTIGLNPLEEYLSSSTAAETETLQPAENSESEQPVKKQRVTIHIPVELIEKVKNAVFWEPGLTIAAFAEMALGNAVQEMEKERGAPYPLRKYQLKSGRPMK